MLPPNVFFASHYKEDTYRSFQILDLPSFENAGTTKKGLEFEIYHLVPPFRFAEFKCNFKNVTNVTFYVATPTECS